VLSLTLHSPFLPLIKKPFQNIKQNTDKDIQAQVLVVLYIKVVQELSLEMMLRMDQHIMASWFGNMEHLFRGHLLLGKGHLGE
jgi:hypothetical protein